LWAWFLKSKTGGKEFVNCDISGKKIDNDLHFVLGKTPNHDADECGSVTAEITRINGPRRGTRARSPPSRITLSAS